MNGRNSTDLIALAPWNHNGNGVGAPGWRRELVVSAQMLTSVSGARAEGQAYLLDDVDIQGSLLGSTGRVQCVLGTSLAH